MEEKEVVLPNSKQFTVCSSDGRVYRIFIYVPDQAAPSAGFPVMYLLDGSALFPTMVDAVRLQSRRPEKTMIEPSIIVGIGYESDAPFADERYYDFTIAKAEFELTSKWKEKMALEQGGANRFLDFIETKLKPKMEQTYPINKKRQSLIGHSLGGLFVLHTLFTRPHMFQTYIAGSPSIHWNKAALAEEEGQFTARDNQASLVIIVGELEKYHSSHMNDNASKLASRLAKDTSLRIQFEELEEENHISVLPVLLNKALKFIFSNKDG